MGKTMYRKEWEAPEWDDFDFWSWVEEIEEFVKNKRKAKELKRKNREELASRKDYTKYEAHLYEGQTEMEALNRNSNNRKSGKSKENTRSADQDRKIIEDNKIEIQRLIAEGQSAPKIICEFGIRSIGLFYAERKKRGWERNTQALLKA